MWERETKEQKLLERHKILCHLLYHSLSIVNVGFRSKWHAFGCYSFLDPSFWLLSALLAVHSSTCSLCFGLWIRTIPLHIHWPFCVSNSFYFCSSIFYIAKITLCGVKRRKCCWTTEIARICVEDLSKSNQTWTDRVINIILLSVSHVCVSVCVGIKIAIGVWHLHKRPLPAPTKWQCLFCLYR